MRSAAERELFNLALLPQHNWALGNNRKEDRTGGR